MAAQSEHRVYFGYGFFHCLFKHAKYWYEEVRECDECVAPLLDRHPLNEAFVSLPQNSNVSTTKRLVKMYQ